MAFALFILPATSKWNAHDKKKSATLVPIPSSYRRL